MGRFNPNSLTKEQLDKAVRTGRISDYYLGENTCIKEIATKDGGYILKLIEYAPNTQKKHIQMDFIYNSNGTLIDQRLHKF